MQEARSKAVRFAETDVCTAQKLADYENENQTLAAKLRQEQRKNGEAALQPAPQPAPGRPAQLSRFGSLMRKPVPSAANGAVQAPGSREKELEEKVVKEQTARIAAEEKNKELNAEIEDLTANVFEQAGEMVATERKENAALAEKICLLESRQRDQAVAVKEQAVESKASLKLEAENIRLKAKIETLEKRAVERTKRLERLETANKRIERVKTMLKPG